MTNSVALRDDDVSSIWELSGYAVLTLLDVDRLQYMYIGICLLFNKDDDN